MATTPTMTHFATVTGTSGRTRKLALSLPLVDCITEQANNQPPPTRPEFELPEERRRNVTARVIRGALGNGPPAAARLKQARGRVWFEQAMRKIFDEPRYFKRTVTPPTAADTSAPILGPLSCKITPLAFCN
jgi:hypothetical protein